MESSLRKAFIDCTCHFVKTELREKCPICLQLENSSDEVAATEGGSTPGAATFGCIGLILSCGHMFHAECIEQWLHRVPTCPLCRQEVPLCTSCTTPNYEFPVAETAIPTMFSLPEFLSLIKIQDLSDVIRRGFCDFGHVYGVDRSTYVAVMRLFSEYQTLDDDFIEDYYSDLDIEMIYSRRDELLLSPHLISEIEKDLNIYQ
jgi:hypothetical protein